MEDVWRHDGTLVLSGSIHRMIRYAMLCIAAAIICASSIRLPQLLPWVPIWIGYTIAGIGAAFFLPIAGHWVYSAIRGNPHVVVDADGVCDCRSGLVIPWTNVTKVWIRNNHMLILKLNETSEAMVRVSPLHRLFHHTYGQMDGGDCGIALGGLTPAIGVVKVFLQTYQPTKYVQT